MDAANTIPVVVDRTRSVGAQPSNQSRDMTLNTTPSDRTFWVTTSLAMVWATWVPNTTCSTTILPSRKATKLKKAAQTTASRGESTRVETMVAMELAASWKPLV